MKLFEKVIIILAVVAGCIAIIVVLTFALAPGGDKGERILPAYEIPEEQEALVIYVSGSVYYYRDHMWKAVSIGQLVTADDYIKTFERSHCEIQFGQRVVISIRPNTSFKVADVFHSQGVLRSDGTLLYGSLLYKVEKLTGGDQVKVSVGTKAFGVRGTEFIVERQGNTTICGVKEGRVAVYAAGTEEPERLIAAGREVAVNDDTGKTSAATTLSRTRRSLLEGLKDITPVSLLPEHEMQQVKVAIEVEPAAAEILLDGRSVGFGYFAGIFPAGTPLNLTLQKNGYREQTFSITPKRGDNRIYSFKLDLDDPDKGSLPPDQSQEYEQRIKKLESDFRKAVSEKEALRRERDALKRENARLTTDLEEAQRKIKEAVEKLQ